MGKIFFSDNFSCRNLPRLTICKNFQVLIRLASTDLKQKKIKKTTSKTVKILEIEELNKKYKLVKPGYKVLDIGACSPPWLNYLTRVTNSNENDKNLPVGTVIAVNELPIQAVEGVQILQNVDFYKKSTQLKIIDLIGKGSKLDIIINKKDLPISGVKEFDKSRLSKMILVLYFFASKYLKTGGSILLNLQNSDFIETVVKQYEEHFKRISFPEIQCAGKQVKSELYLLARDLKF